MPYQPIETTIPRVCPTCSHFKVEGDEHEGGFNFDCDKRRWLLVEEHPEMFAAMMLTALNCDLYERIQVTPAMPTKPPEEVRAEARAALKAKYPSVEFKIENDPRHRAEWRASYNVGDGWTLSERFRDELGAIAWLDERIGWTRAGKAAEEPHAVPTD